MLESIKNAWRIGDLRKRLFFTLGIFLVYRIGTHVPVPGMDAAAVGAKLFTSGTIFAFMDLFSGGALQRLSIFALNIYPYITASIVMNLLTIIVPQLELLAKEGGEEGRKKINQYTRYFTVVLAGIQAFGVTFTLRQYVADWNWFTATVIMVSFVAGAILLMWLGERITEHGIGNGISLIIFSGIVSRLPAGAINIYNYVAAGSMSVILLLALIAAALLIIVAVIRIQEGQRRIPVQYAKRVVGRKMYGGQSSHIPLKVNQAGVIPIIFASSLLAFPLTIAQFFPGSWIAQAADYVNPGSVVYSVFYVMLIIFFTYFYTAITFNPVDVADNLKRNGGFVPGLRPGRPTSDYLTRTLNRITVAGAIFLAFIAVLPDLVSALSGIPLTFGGTSLLIVVGVAIETMRQIEAQMLMRNYQGFLK